MHHAPTRRRHVRIELKAKVWDVVDVLAYLHARGKSRISFPNFPSFALDGRGRGMTEEVKTWIFKVLGGKTIVTL